jgi:HK97 family phage major capsid protein
MGLLNPNSGVPICEVGANTLPGTFSWQDLVMLAYEVPVQWHSGAVFLMNQRSFALLMTTSTAEGRPLFGQLPSGAVGPQLAGFPIRIASQMPDCGPGSTPVLFGNLKSAYTVVDRQATTVLADPYSAGYCHLFKWEARLGGACTCPNALRLLRIK